MPARMSVAVVESNPDERLPTRPPAAALAPLAPPALDEAQQRVVDHKGGPLLVLAGPGTGKTTTIVAAVAERIERRGVDPEPHPGAHLQQEGGGRAARPHHRAARPHHLRAARAHLPQLRLRAGPPGVRAGGRPAAAAALRAGAAARDPPDAARRGRRRRAELAGAAAARARHQGLRRGAARRPDARRGARARRQGAAPARPARPGGTTGWRPARSSTGTPARFDLAPVPAYDYAEIVRIAARLLARQATRQRERDAYDAVFVDEYQDSDPAQEALLRALAGDGRDLVAVGDPDQSIYAFRGADVRVLTGFPDKFRGPDGVAGPGGRAAHLPPQRPGAARRVAPGRRAGCPAVARPAAIPARAPPACARARWRRRPGEVRICVADTQAQEAAVVADTLRRAHLADGVPWGRMAVLVRSAQRQVPALRRALTAAGVPVTVAGDELPLPDEPGVRPLLTLLRCALAPGRLDDETAAELLTGPLGQTDSLGLRKLRRALDGDPAARGARPIRRGTARGQRPGRRAWPPGRRRCSTSRARPARRTAPAPRTCCGRSGTRPGSPPGGRSGPSTTPPPTGTWTRCSRCSRPRPVHRRPAAGQPAAVPRQPGRPGDRRRHAGRARGPRGLRARADRAPGQGPGVGRGGRRRGAGRGLARPAAARLAARRGRARRGGRRAGDAPDATTPASGAPRDVAAAALAARLLAEERRLFYVAATRARQLLMVTASGGDEQDQRPSRFLAELAGERHRDRAGGRRDPVAVAARAGRGPAQDRGGPGEARRAAAGRGRASSPGWRTPGVRGADPARLVRADRAVRRRPDRRRRRAGQAVAVARGDVHPLRPALAARVRGRRRAARTCCGTWARSSTPPRSSSPTAPPSSRSRAASTTYGTTWTSAASGTGPGSGSSPSGWSASSSTGTRPTRGSCSPPSRRSRCRSGRVEITGRVDRLERDDAGPRRHRGPEDRAGPRRATKSSDRHPQLGVYQLAVLLGAFEQLGVTEPGGAELVQVGKAGLTARARVQRQRPLSDDPDPGWAEDLVDAVAAGHGGPGLPGPGEPRLPHLPGRLLLPGQHPDGAATVTAQVTTPVAPASDCRFPDGTLDGQEVPSVDYVTSRPPASKPR